MLREASHDLLSEHEWPHCYGSGMDKMSLVGTVGSDQHLSVYPKSPLLWTPLKFLMGFNIIEDCLHQLQLPPNLNSAIYISLY